MNIVIIYGPQASGKTRRAQQFLDHFRCERLVDDWNGEDPLRDGDLALTTLEPPFHITGARAIPVASAKAAVTGIDINEMRKGGAA